MHTSAKIIKFREQPRQRQAESAALESGPASRQGGDVKTMHAINLELATLIHELERYIPNYPRI